MQNKVAQDCTCFKGFQQFQNENFFQKHAANKSKVAKINVTIRK